jgi:hypothetical protein
MKEQILSLEPTDDLQSLRDKITRGQAGRLVLLWPALTEPINRRLDFALLRRWAVMSGSELMVVSADSEVRRLAAQAGIPCYLNLKETALHGISDRGREKAAGVPPSGPHSRPLVPIRAKFFGKLPLAIRIALFSSAIFSLVILFLLLIPSAQIQATFSSRSIEVSKLLDPSLCSQISIHLELTARRNTSGFISVPIAYAKGTVILTNKSTRTLDLPAGIRVSSKSGVFLETIAGVIIPAGKTQPVLVRAVKPGTSGNLGAGGVDHVDGLLALSLQATNPEPISGGEQAWRSAVTQADLDGLRSTLSEQVRQQAELGMQNLAAAGRTLVEKSLEVKFNPADAADLPVNSASDTVGLTLHAVASAQGCPTGIIRSRAVSVLTAGLAAGETLSSSSIAFRLEKTAPGAIGLQASGMAVKIPDRYDMAMALRARTPAQAAAILRSRFDARSIAGMDLSPAWIPLLPLFPYQIEISAGTE